MKARVRRALVRASQGAGQIVLGRRLAASVTDVARGWKRSDSLCVIAPGASIEAIEPADWQYLRGIDTIGVNYFLLHAFTARAYMIEPHPDRGYFDFLASNRERFADSAFFYKGYASPSKMRRVVHELRRFRSAGVERLLMLDERYIQDCRGDIACTDQAWLDDEAFLHMGSSLSFGLDMGYRLRYSNVILAGFDFSESYFVASLETQGDASAQVSAVVADADRRSATLRQVDAYVERIRARGGTVSGFRLRGPLASRLPAFVPPRTEVGS